jgi:hypothetical protein
MTCAAARTNPAGGNVHWRSVGKRGVIDTGKYWTTRDGALIYWGGNETVRAQAWLRSQAKARPNPPGPGPFVVAVGSPDHCQYVAGLVNEPTRTRLLLTDAKASARRLSRMACARLVRLIRTRSRTPVRVLVP